MSDTIAAVATGGAQTAIGIIRLSGDQAIEIAQKVFRSREPISQAPDRKLVYGTLHGAAGQVIDRCLATVSRAPGTYTGENTAEFQCHGSPMALSLALEAIFAAGARQAERGEFSKRAFLNGRMDLSQAEAVIDLISAETPWAAANAAEQLGGALKRRVEALYDSLLNMAAHFQAFVDYPEDDVEEFTLMEARHVLAAAIGEVRALSQGYGRGRLLREGAPTAIIGKPNVGKSSLLNALAGYERAIVTDIAGTTRDTIEERVLLGDILLRLTDTAGIRQTEDKVEHLGVQRSLQAAQGAWLCLAVFDGSRPLEAEDESVIEAAGQAENAIAVINKCDLPQVLDTARLEQAFSRICRVSAVAGTGLEILSDAVAELEQVPRPDGSLLTNLRQHTAAKNALAALERALEALDNGQTPDAVLTDAEAAMEFLGEITGATVREDLVSRVFSRFCVGK